MMTTPLSQTDPDACGPGANTTLLRRPATGECRTSPLQLVVLEASGLSAYALPASGILSIGRAEGCDVRLRDALASRRHASLHVRPLAIEDCGSANGTHVGNTLLAKSTVRPLLPGEPVSIGSSLLLVQRSDPHGLVVSDHRPPPVPEGCERHGQIVADNPVMKQLYATIERVAQVPINVLVLGETGVGKDLVAEAVHSRSPRRSAPLVRINCAALSEPLLESELFGHERGAFTGAVSSKVGLIEAANRGTVFLDEVGELTPGLQAKLLRAIEAREVLRVGAVRARTVDVRFVSATNRDLASEVSRGTFRADLFFRLNGVCLQVPPLRERPGEIVALARAFLSRALDRTAGRVPPRLTLAAIDRLRTHSWPGNVRELKNEMERAALLCQGPEIGPLDLSLLDLVIPGQVTRSDRSAGTLRPRALPSAEPFDTGSNAGGSDRAGERERIVEALAKCNGNQTRAAKRLGMPRRTFVAKLGHHDIPRPRKP